MAIKQNSQENKRNGEGNKLVLMAPPEGGGGLPHFGGRHARRLASRKLSDESHTRSTDRRIPTGRPHFGGCPARNAAVSCRTKVKPGAQTERYPGPTEVTALSHTP